MIYDNDFEKIKNWKKNFNYFHSKRASKRFVAIKSKNQTKLNGLSSRTHKKY